jgi:hypothetical protein
MNKKLKIGISLMVALAFVLPAAAIATPDKGGGSEAGTRAPSSMLINDTPTQVYDGKMDGLIPYGRFVDGQVVPLNPGDTDADLFVEDPDGNIFELTEDMIILPEDNYKFWARITPQGELPDYVEPELELYQCDKGEEYVLYETSFEDNALNYMEWGQIDFDCGLSGGYYDGWSWSDARASEGDHSFKCTMYDEYKNEQYDRLYMKDLIDLTDFDEEIEWVTFSFDIWVQGEGADWGDDHTLNPVGEDAYTVLDFFTFGVTDGGVEKYADNNDDQQFIRNLYPVLGMEGYDWTRNWDLGNFYFFDTSLPLYESIQYGPHYNYLEKADKIDGAPGWWNVWFKVPINYFDNPESVGLWFDWLSDKERVFEGAYIDNIQIVGTGVQCEKIFQSHSQQWLELTEEGLNDLGDYWFEFPLVWDDVVESYNEDCGIDDNDMFYRAILKMKNNDPIEEGAADLTLHLVDTYGDGWEAGSFVDVYVDGVLEVAGATISYGTDEYFTIPAVPNGATVDVIYTSGGGYWESEHEWQLLLGTTTLIQSGQGGVIPGSDSVVISGLGNDGYDLVKPIKFEVGELKQNIVENIQLHDEFTGELINGVAEEGTSIHMTYTARNLGNIKDDIDVTASAYKLEEEELLFMDFEGFAPDMMGFAGNARLPYTSDKFAWSGSKSLAFNDPDTLHYGEYDVIGGVFNQVIDMEGVTEAYLDHYYMGKLGTGDFFGVLGYTGGAYVWWIDFLIGDPGTGIEDKVDPWIGPMQPQCSYGQINLYNVFKALEANGETLDANGNPTFDLSLAYLLVSNGDDKFYYGDEYDWSGAYLDDVRVTATVLGDKVWTQEKTISGCEPNDICTDQFLWENVPFSCYRVIFETDSPPQHVDMYDICQDTVWAWEDFCVLKDLKKMAKADGVDYSVCADDAWCISDVVGNDFGDHYALATNCDSNEWPGDVNDYVGLGPGDDCVGMDISHFEIAAGGGGGCEPFENTLVGDYENAAYSWYFSDTYSGYEIIDNYEMSGEITSVSFTGISAYGDGSFIGNDFIVRFYEDAGGSPGSMVFEETYTCDTEVDTGLLLFAYYPILEGTIELSSPVDLEDGWFSVQMDDSWEQLAIGPSIDFDNYLAQYRYGAPYGEDYFDAAFALDCEAKASPLAITYDCGIVLDESFDFCDGNDGDPATPAGWSGSGWLCNYYGYANTDPGWAYSWAMGDELTTPPIEFGNSTDPAHPGTMLYFSHAVESSTNEMSMDILVDGILVAQIIDADNTDYIDYMLDLTPLGLTGPHTISFIGQTTDFYGQMLDDIIVETCNQYGTEDVGDRIDLELTYQVDLPMSSPVYVEVYGFEEGEAGWCDSCEPDPCYCPPGENAWEVAATIAGHTPGVIKTLKVDLAPFLDENDTMMCLRLRFDSTADEDGGPGIGFHLHEYTLYNFTYDELTGEITDYVEDFEDGMMEHEPGCVLMGEYWSQNEDNYNQFCQEWPAEPVDNALVWSTSIEDAYYATLYASRTMDIGAGTTVNLELSDNGGEDWFIISSEEGPKSVSSDLTLVLTDDYGDGWTDYTNWATLDVYVNGVLVLDDITCTGSIATFTVAGNEGDTIEVCYDSGGMTMWESEHAWQLLMGTTVLLESGQGGTEPTVGCMDTVHPGFQAPPFPCTPFDLTPWAGKDILIRVHVTDEDGVGGWVCVEDFLIMGKIDTEAPMTTISLSGNSVGPNTYDGAVTVTITATDDTGMGQIHYTIDGTEKVVDGNKASFNVDSDGTHTVTYWGVDAAGNVGAVGSVSFFIDASPPSVELVGPEPGLYLFGSKLLSMSKPFIIGAFTAEASATDAQGVQLVEFKLNGELVGADNEAPYTMYIAVKNMGSATLSATAVDGVGNTADDSMDITYFKLL